MIMVSSAAAAVITVTRTLQYLIMTFQQISDPDSHCFYQVRNSIISKPTSLQSTASYRLWLLDHSAALYQRPHMISCTPAYGQRF